jgi:micrococcal nuclease
MRLKPLLIKAVFTLLLLTGLTILLFTSLSFAREPIRTVTKVSDGDTIHVTTPDRTKLRVRLYGIDAPETPKINQRTGRVNKPGQPYGEESWRALKNRIMGMQVRLDILDIDKYKRMVGMIWLDNRNINLEMVREGYAEAYVEYLKESLIGHNSYWHSGKHNQRRGEYGLCTIMRDREIFGSG